MKNLNNWLTKNNIEHKEVTLKEGEGTFIKATDKSKVMKYNRIKHYDWNYRGSYDYILFTKRLTKKIYRGVDCRGKNFEGSILSKCGVDKVWLYNGIQCACKIDTLVLIKEYEI